MNQLHQCQLLYVPHRLCHLLVTDLGADQIRVFSIGTSPSSPRQVQEVGGLDLPKGSFPRHVPFVALRDRNQLYVLNQDITTLSTYTVEYVPEGSMFMHNRGDDIDLLKRIKGDVPKAPEGVRLTESHLAVSVSNDSKVLHIWCANTNASFHHS